MTEVHLMEGGPPVELPLSDAVGDALHRSGVVSAIRLGRGVWEVAPLAKVGVAQVAGITFWLRPKIPIARLLFLLGYASRPGWRDELVTMDPAPDLLPALATAFADRAQEALEQGLLQGYTEREDVLPVLRGRLREQDQLRRRFGIAVPLMVRFDDHSVDIAENRLLRAAVELLLTLPGVGRHTRGRLRHLRGILADVSRPVRGAPPPQWEPNRLNARCHVALWLAEILLARNALDQRPGAVAVGGFIVDMWRVFEDFVTTGLRQSLERHGGRCVAQDVQHLDERCDVVMRPDLVWYRSGRIVAVIDAKYKAERPHGFPDADLYQALAYCTALRLRDGHLVYAKGNERETSHAVRHAGIILRAHALDLAVPPRELLTQVDDLAARIAAAAEARGLPASTAAKAPAPA